jgi:outer membrane protein TolC
MATETELLDATDDLADAETAEVAARAAVRLAEADLLYTAGR